MSALHCQQLFHALLPGLHARPNALQAARRPAARCGRAAAAAARAPSGRPSGISPRPSPSCTPTASAMRRSAGQTTQSEPAKGREGCLQRGGGGLPAPSPSALPAAPQTVLAPWLAMVSYAHPRGPVARAPA